jgi:hypothetical protein
MISSASSSLSSAQTNLSAGLGAKASGRPAMLGEDQLDLGKTSELRRTFSQEPAIRAEVVARARALAADPAYPSTKVLRDVAMRLISSPDLSEQSE